MKYIVIAFFCILGMPVAYSSDFRDISWGMSLDQIKEIENAKLEFRVSYPLKDEKSIKK